MDHNGTTIHFVIEARNAQNRWFSIATLPEADAAESYMAKVQASMPGQYRMVQIETTRRILTLQEV